MKYNLILKDTLTLSEIISKTNFIRLWRDGEIKNSFSPLFGNVFNYEVGNVSKIEATCFLNLEEVNIVKISFQKDNNTNSTSLAEINFDIGLSISKVEEYVLRLIITQSQEVKFDLVPKFETIGISENLIDGDPFTNALSFSKTAEELKSIKIPNCNVNNPYDLFHQTNSPISISTFNLQSNKSNYLRLDLPNQVKIPNVYPAFNLRYDHLNGKLFCYRENSEGKLECIISDELDKDLIDFTTKPMYSTSGHNKSLFNLMTSRYYVSTDLKLIDFETGRSTKSIAKDKRLFMDRSKIYSISGRLNLTECDISDHYRGIDFNFIESILTPGNFTLVRYESGIFIFKDIFRGKYLLMNKYNQNLVLEGIKDLDIISEKYIIRKLNSSNGSIVELMKMVDGSTENIFSYKRLSNFIQINPFSDRYLGNKLLGKLSELVNGRYYYLKYSNPTYKLLELL